MQKEILFYTINNPWKFTRQNFTQILHENKWFCWKLNVGRSNW